MKKMVFMAAFVAACAAFVACSSNDDLVQQKPDVPEETVDGTPLTIKVTDATRGTEIKAANLDNLYMYSIKAGTTGASNRWLGIYDNGESTPVTFTKNAEGDLESAEPINWPEGTDGYDFYALSDATFASESDGGEGTQAAEHLDASPRSFTYTVTNDYANQKDLLVGSALNQKATTASGNVTIPLQHALARIKSVKLKYHASDNNAGMFFVIKSMTLKNVASTATFTFPQDGEGHNVELTAANVNAAWSDQANLVDYTFTFPDFERDDNDNVLIFDENQNTTAGVYENEYLKFNNNTHRGGPTSSLPNYLTINEDGSLQQWEFPLAKVEVDNTTNPATTTITKDDGLYILPQTLTKTIAPADNDVDDKYNLVETSPYLEIHFYGINASYDTSFDEYFTSGAIDGASITSFADESKIDEGGNGLSLALGNHSLITNARINYALENEEYLSTVVVPLSQMVFEAGKYYSLTAYFNLAMENEGSSKGLRIFSGSTVSSGD